MFILDNHLCSIQTRQGTPPSHSSQTNIPAVLFSATVKLHFKKHSREPIRSRDVTQQQITSNNLRMNYGVSLNWSHKNQLFPVTEAKRQLLLSRRLNNTVTKAFKARSVYSLYGTMVKRILE
ncbi:hypothetical protein CEXT_161781 [Caerostris extrusa]|uniref:Uncharacterized protein n=1 Tax=Caerostris extrusa TaxID=172846 RepID=A0AAV4VTG8_CAEEX|nr:hypothetical protein CEXT_161781 [Caerostris extrusa]